MLIFLNKINFFLEFFYEFNQVTNQPMKSTEFQ